MDSGVPKGEGLESRPISVASIWARSWHKSLLLCFPPVPEVQWCCRTGAGVVQGTADWLARPCRAGMELDLSKAFDTLSHEVLRVALEDMRLLYAVVSILLCAWRAPRICQAHGELAAPILPLCGVPQGDPCSPRALAALLSAWNPCCDHWLYMDDRTITTDGTTAEPDLDAALQYTTEFDAALGLTENRKKRQRWSLEVPSLIEHLGLLTQPMLPDAPILPRGGWQKVGKVIAHLAALLGPVVVRERLAAAFVRPHFTWACPIQHPPPADLARQLLRAILLTRCSWYCAGRWWADRIQLPPAISAGLQAFKPAPNGLLQSAALHCSWKAHAKTFGLTLVGYTWSRAPLLEACEDDSARILSAVENGRAPGQRPLTFQADTEAGQHALRIIGRVRLPSVTCVPPGLRSNLVRPTGPSMNAG